MTGVTVKVCGGDACDGCGSKRCGKHDDEATSCADCGAPIFMSNARWDATLGYCFGCMGWPHCQCPERHRGDCK